MTGFVHLLGSIFKEYQGLLSAKILDAAQRMLSGLEVRQYTFAGELRRSNRASTKASTVILPLPYSSM